MQTKLSLEAKQRMTKLLLSDEIQKRIDKLNVDKGAFHADMLYACARTGEMALIDAFEIFTMGELCAKLGVRLGAKDNGAELNYAGGHAVLSMDFSAVHALCRRFGL